MSLLDRLDVPLAQSRASTIAVVFLAMASGLFVVPLYAFIQQLH